MTNQATKGAFAALRQKIDQATPFGSYTAVRKDDTVLGQASPFVLKTAAAMQAVQKQLDLMKVQVRYEADAGERYRMLGEGQKAAAELQALQAVYALQLASDFSQHVGMPITLRSSSDGVVAVVTRKDSAAYAQAMQEIGHSFVEQLENASGGQHDCSANAEALDDIFGLEGDDMPKDLAEALSRAFGGRVKVMAV